MALWGLTPVLGTIGQEHYTQTQLFCPYPFIFFFFFLSFGTSRKEKDSIIHPRLGSEKLYLLFAVHSGAQLRQYIFEEIALVRKTPPKIYENGLRLLVLVTFAILYFPSVDKELVWRGDMRCAEVTLAHISLPVCQSFPTLLSPWGSCVEAVVQMQMSPRVRGREKPSSA